MTTRQISIAAFTASLVLGVLIALGVHASQPYPPLAPYQPPPARLPAAEPLGIIGVPCNPGEHCVPRRCTSGLGAAVAWPMHVISGGVDGADGVDVLDLDSDGDPDILTAPYEQGAVLTVSQPSSVGNVQKMWPTATIVTGLSGAEDAKWGDIDKDTWFDSVAAGQSGTPSVRIAFSPTSTALGTWLHPAGWTAISLTAASGVDNWIQVAVADIDADGEPDIVAGGRSLSPSTLRWFKSPGAGSYRTAASWTANTIGNVGWTMSLIPLDVDGDSDIDVVISDRDATGGLRGVRYLENQSSGTVWVNHTIFTPAVGEELKFLDIANMDGDGDLDIVLAVSGATYNRVFLLTNPGTWAGVWTSAELTAPSSVGQGHGVDVGDIDADGNPDIVVTYASCAGVSCAVWLKGPSWTRQEISGVSEEKLDNAFLLDADDDGDLDLFTASQRDGSGTYQRGVIWYENCRAP